MRSGSPEPHELLPGPPPVLRSAPQKRQLRLKFPYGRATAQERLAFEKRDPLGLDERVLQVGPPKEALPHEVDVRP